jgi:hypothetical protein
MAKSQPAVTLLALVLSAATLPFTALAADVCQNPTFRFSQGSPFKLQPKPGVDSQPTALAAGTYVARPGVQTGCGCDLAVGLESQSVPPQGFVARLRGNDDGTFTGSPDKLHQVDGIPVAIATGRFQTNSPVDGIVAVTSTGQGNGQVQVFVPDENGAYPQSPTATFQAGPNPAAITTGDFNGDGMLDVAVLNLDNSSLTILLGDGRGTFANPLTVANLASSLQSLPNLVLAASSSNQLLTTGRFSGSPNADDIAIGVVQTAGGADQVGIVIVPGSSSGRFAAEPIILVGQRNTDRPSIAAANLSGPSLGTAGRRWRDLAIAFTDHTPSGPVGRVKVLLGRDGGGFGDVNAAQTLDLGAVQPRSISVADLDGDGVVDLIVSTYPDLASQTDGSTIRFFQGHAAPPLDVGFRPNPRWFTIPATTGIRPYALVPARFGNHNPAQPLASMGIAAINAPNLNSVAVFQGNGQGSFVQPSLVTTLVGEDDHLFVSGDFHSGNGSSPLQDLAFITKDAVGGQNVLGVLQADGAGGFAPPDPGPPPLLAGNSPSLMAAGQFVAGPTALAVVDDTGGVGQQPVLKIFFGQGNGLLTAGTELLLNNAGQPRAMTTGRFRGPNMPLDIALVGDTTPPGGASSGKLTLLFNNGQGGFTVGATQVLSFAPSSIATSSQLRPGGKADLLIRDAQANRFLFLVNIGDGSFRLAIGPNNGLFDGAGDFDALLVGDVAHGGANPLDDVITFDHDMTLKIFVNNGLESFNLRTVAPGGDPHFAGAQPPYLLADFGSGTLSLAAPVSLGGQISLLVLQGDGSGGFTPATGQVPLKPVRGISTTTLQTKFSQVTCEPGYPFGFCDRGVGSITGDIQVRQTVAAQFRSALHGNSKPDFAFVTKATENGTTVGNCAGNTQTPPPRSPLVHAPVCPIRDNEPCCRCDRSRLGGNICPNSCDFPEPDTPYSAFCERASTFTPVLTVFANTCGD